jgi:hypothetical protein
MRVQLRVLAGMKGSTILGHPLATKISSTHALLLFPVLVSRHRGVRVDFEFARLRPNGAAAR